MFLRKIKDIQISKKEISITRDATLSIEELEKQISLISYEPAKDSKCSETENLMLPPFIQVFYFLFFSYLKIPTLHDCWNTYASWLGGESDNKLEINGIKYDLEGIRNRLNRTYPSLIRDLHFLYLIEESGKFDKVDYSMDRDYYNGLDLKITYKKQDIYVSIFIDTSRSRYFKHKKTERHDYSIINEIEFQVSFNSLSKIGYIYLLNNKHVELLENMIHETR